MTMSALARSKSLSLLATEARLRRRLSAHLAQLRLSEGNDKEAIRRVHAPQRASRLAHDAAFVASAWPELSGYFADGVEVDPRRVSARIEPVVAGTWQARLFRLASLTWSVPVSQGYGRRMRFLVWDDHNGRLIGLIGLTDPVFNLKARDSFVGWNAEQRRSRLAFVMDAHVLGAVPPYNMLLGGKLVAGLLKTVDVRDEFARRYASSSGTISQQKKRARLVMVTTSSALGRSSVYNRLRLNGQTILLPIGYTLGWGHFHISGALFDAFVAYLARRRHPYARNNRFGDGPNWRMRVIRQCLVMLGLRPVLLQHGIRREVFVCELATNARAVLSGTARRPRYAGLMRVGEISAIARDRWMVPRAIRRPEFREWKREQLLGLLVPQSSDELIKRTLEVAAS